MWLKPKKPDVSFGCKHRMRNVVKLAMVWPAVALFATPGAAAGAAGAAQPITPYNPPSFHCQFVQFGNGQAPALTGYPQDPLCVEYDKRNITASNGGAVTFVLAEPTRFAIAVPKCQYWQLDHWSIQLTPTDGALVQWDGSYWFDKGQGTGGVLLRNFTVAGQPVGAWQAAAAVEAADPEVATLIRSFGAGPAGGGGASFSLGGGDPQCSS